VGVIAPVIDQAWLATHLPEVVLADVRWYLGGPPGREAYDRGHLPGAVYVDLDEVLAAPPDPREGRHPLPDPERFAAAIGAVGIGDHDTVIAYDDVGGVVASRLVWLLRVTGHDAALLDGGIQALPAADLRQDHPRPRLPAAFTPVPWPAESFAEIDEVAVTGDVLIDARDPERFAGGPDPVDPRSGHIPGALSVPTRGHIDQQLRIADAERLRETFAAVGITAGTPVISYCGSGVTACHNLLALERAGLGPSRLYAGSWSEWSRDAQRPIATG
jgi:thiosulfate/3-mercaptopyruvate sulfurtransferase